jgi:hypothetical protein
MQSGPKLLRVFTTVDKKNYDAPDIAVRIFHMKLQELLQDIKSGKIFGPCKAGVNILFPFLYIHILRFNC